VWLETGEGVTRCALSGAGCAVTSRWPDPEMSHDGPGEGFDLDLSGARLTLTLPRGGADDPRIEIATDVARVIGVTWIGERPPKSVETALNRNFRGNGDLIARPRSITVDGSLADWGDAGPLVVDAPWQLEYGADGWSDNRDGGVSVAAARDGDRLCVGGNVRDDAVTDEDTIVVYVEEIEVRIPLKGPAPEGFVQRRIPFGRSWEGCLAFSPVVERIPFAVAFLDVDPGEPETLLASAAMKDGVPGGSVRTLSSPR